VLFIKKEKNHAIRHEFRTIMGALLHRIEKMTVKVQNLFAAILMNIFIFAP